MHTASYTQFSLGMYVHPSIHPIILMCLQTYQFTSKNANIFKLKTTQTGHHYITARVIIIISSSTYFSRPILVLICPAIHRDAGCGYSFNWKVRCICKFHKLIVCLQLQSLVPIPQLSHISFRKSFDCICLSGNNNTTNEKTIRQTASNGAKL